MPVQTVKIIPGVKLEQTPTLLQAAVIKSNLIRWRGGLPEKLGGWAQFYAFFLSGITRALWAWEDLSFTKHLALGTTTELVVLTGPNQQNLTPQNRTSSIPPVFAATAGSPIITITDASSNLVLG